MFFIQAIIKAKVGLFDRYDPSLRNQWWVWERCLTAAWDTAIRATNHEMKAWLVVVDKSDLPSLRPGYTNMASSHGFSGLSWSTKSWSPQSRALRGGSAGSYGSGWVCLNSITLYRQNNKLRIPISSLNEDFMVTLTREVLQHRESCNPKVSQAGIEFRTGRKWRAAEAVEDAESRLRHRVLVGAVLCGRAGLGSSTTPCYGTGEGQEVADPGWSARRSKPVGWLECGCRESEQEGSKWWSASLISIPYGGVIHHLKAGNLKNNLRCSSAWCQVFLNHESVLFTNLFKLRKFSIWWPFPCSIIYDHSKMDFFKKGK